jgi:hypothetical protein
MRAAASLDCDHAGINAGYSGGVDHTYNRAGVDNGTGKAKRDAWPTVRNQPARIICYITWKDIDGCSHSVQKPNFILSPRNIEPREHEDGGGCEDRQRRYALLLRLMDALSPFTLSPFKGDAGWKHLHGAPRQRDFWWTLMLRQFAVRTTAVAVSAVRVRNSLPFLVPSVPHDVAKWPLLVR